MAGLEKTYVKVLEVKAKGDLRWSATSVQMPFVGGATRKRQHLLGNSKSIGACDKVLDSVKSELQALEDVEGWQGASQTQ